MHSSVDATVGHVTYPLERNIRDSAIEQTEDTTRQRSPGLNTLNEDRIYDKEEHKSMRPASQISLWS